MPVRRVIALDGVVYAFKHEIDDWLRTTAGRAASGSGPYGGGQPGSSHPIAMSPRSRRRPAGMRPATVVLAAAIAGAAGFAAFLPLADAEMPVRLSLSSAFSGVQGDTFAFKAVGDSALQALRSVQTPDGREGLVKPAIGRNSDGHFEWVLMTGCTTHPGAHRVRLLGTDGTPLSNVVEFQVAEDARCTADLADVAKRLR